MSVKLQESRTKVGFLLPVGEKVHYGAAVKVHSNQHFYCNMWDYNTVF